MNQIFYTGVVEDRKDSLKMGRVRVRVIGVHTENKQELPTEGLPWATPIQSIGSAAMNGIGDSPTGIVEGTWVIVIFNDTAFQQPLILGTIGGIPTSETNEFDGIDADIKLKSETAKDSDVFPSDITPSDIGQASGKSVGFSSALPNLPSIASVAGKLPKSLLGVDVSGAATYLSNLTGADVGILVDSSGTPVLSSDGSQVSTGSAVVADKTGTTSSAVTNNQQTKQPQTYEIKRNPVTWTLGQTSEEFESAGNGVGTINDYLNKASNDPGGASYGLYQFASYLPSSMGNGKLREKRRPSPVEQFVSQSRFKSKFSGLTPATTEFDATWKSIASTYGTDFQLEQHEFTKRTYYDPVIAKLKAKGINLTDNGPAVQDAIWSTSVQFWHGRTISLVSDALTDKKTISDKDFVNAVYDLKLTRFGSTATRVKKEKTKLLALISSGATKDNLSIPSSTATGTITAAQTDTSIPAVDKTDISKFDTVGSNKNTIRKANELGFVDPNGIYPLKEMLNEPDTNRLARGEKVIDTIVGKKQKNRLEGVTVALSGKNWSQPDIPYAATYPYNQVKETEAGHVMEFDNTEGAERIHLYHRTGTFTEIDNTGSEVHRIVGDGYQIIDRNGHVYIGGRCNITVASDCNLYVYGDLNAEVEGDANIVSYNDVDIKASGSMNLSCQETMTLKANDIVFDSDTDISLTAKIKINTSSGSDTNMIVTGNFNKNVSGTDSNIIANSQQNKIGGSSVIECADYNVKSSGDYSANVGNYLVDAASYSFDMGAAHAPSASVVTAIAGEVASFGVPSSPRYDTSGKADLENLVATSRIDNAKMTYETPSDTNSAEYESYKAKSIASGQSQVDDYKTKGIELDKDTTTTTPKKEVIQPSKDVFTSMATFPDNLKLSPNFTLGQVSSNAVVSKYKVQDQFGLKSSDIVANLQNVCLNVLEPIIREFPNAFVTSGFRHNNSTSGKISDHVVGQAVDIQFKGATNKDYYEIAKKIKNLIPYKQLLLEYRENKGRAPSVWIHVSLTTEPAKNTGMVLTLFNDKTHSQGLANLA